MPPSTTSGWSTTPTLVIDSRNATVRTRPSRARVVTLATVRESDAFSEAGR